MITDFETFISRHGEVVAQAVLENIERYEGVRSCVLASLEERWEKVMRRMPAEQMAAA